MKHLELFSGIGGFRMALHHIEADGLTSFENIGFSEIDPSAYRTYAANYDTSLQVIRHISEKGVKSKSGIMVGLGETPEEVETLMDDLLATGCQILTIGQYLQPSHRHYPVAAYITPQQFAEYKTVGLEKGFNIVESAPLVRSSYHAEKHIR